jgi:ribosomal protein S18 acetylase RimI-like enzyme
MAMSPLPAPACIVPATWRDVFAIHRLEKVSFPLDAWPIFDSFAALVLPKTIRLKALAGEALVGYVLVDLRPREGIAWIASIAVHPDYRGQGIGTALLDECERLAGLPRTKLSVRVSNEDAIRLYRRLGYLPVGSWRGYYRGGEDAMIMEKSLR